jgi:hypothetical protein
MNKIMEVALKGKFGENVTEIMEIVNATPNPVMAVEILLGVWEKVEIPEIVRRHDIPRYMHNVNYWTDDVNYKYQEEETKHMYVDKDLDTSIITPENYEEYKKNYVEGDTKSFHLKTGVLKERTGSCSIGEWLKSEAIVNAL